MGHGCDPRNFRRVGFYVKTEIQLSSIQLRYKHNECRMYIFKALGWRSYAVYVFLPSLSGPSIYILQDAKYISTVFFLGSHRPVTIYVKSYLCESSTT